MTFGGAMDPPIDVTGQPSRIQRAEVVTTNLDGTVDVRPINGRAAKAAVEVPAWYVPSTGDIVIIADLDGDRQQPVVIGVHSHAGGAPALAAASLNLGLTVTGSRASGAALTSLLTQLDAAGLIVDNTTA